MLRGRLKTKHATRNTGFPKTFETHPIDKGTILASDVNVFSGANDSGKSNILKALNLFFNSQTDFQKNLKFYDDYNKVSFARVTMAAKMKQQIKIRVYFNVPKSYKSLSSEKEVFIERTFDRYGNRTERYSNDGKRSQITKLINKISYVYIPALKGEKVLEHLLALIGEYQLIDPKSIETLNQQISSKTEDLADLLQDSKIPIGTTFGLPVFLSDFWQKLAVETEFDNFEHISSTIKSKSEPQKKLNPSQFKIPLLLRGDGIKSKYIPPFLLWLNEKNKSRIYVWGIDEPENSLEFKLSSELADLFFNEYGLKTQIFLTSHSLAFINPPEKVKSSPFLYRCLKDDNGVTVIKSFSDLFKKQDQYNFYDEIGALEVQKEVIEAYRRIANERDVLGKKIETYEKPIVLTEGKTDAKILRKAWEKLYPDEELPVEFIASGVEISEEKRSGNADQVRRGLELSSNMNKGRVIIGLFDNDREGNEQFKGANKKSFNKHQLDEIIRKHRTKEIYALLLPCPESRQFFVSPSSITQRYLVIEHYFDDDVLSDNNLKGENILDTEIFEISDTAKSEFAESAIANLDADKFNNFEIFFDKLKELIVNPDGG